jgi:hypothetical protein
LVGVAVKLILDPKQMLFPDALDAMVTAGVVVVITVLVIPELVAVLLV